MPTRHTHEASTDFSTQHYVSAELFAKISAQIESDSDGTPVPSELYDHHQAYVSGAVFASVAFLEAYINELFHHCYESPASVLPLGLNAQQIELLGRLWGHGVPRTSKFGVTEKFEIALDLLAAEPLERGNFPYQDVSLLVKIRNKLVHFEPDSYPIPGPYLAGVPDESVPKFEKALRNKFALNPLARDTFGFFPDKCLSAGCADWSLRAVREFAAEFCEKAGIQERFKGPLANYRSRRTQVATGPAREQRSFWKS